MGKKKGGKSSGNMSKGMHSNVSKSLLNALKADRPAWVKTVNQLDAHNKGKRVMVTINNPNKEHTNKRFIRVSADTIWRDPKQSGYIIF